VSDLISKAGAMQQMWTLFMLWFPGWWNIWSCKQASISETLPRILIWRCILWYIISPFKSSHSLQKLAWLQYLIQYYQLTYKIKVSLFHADIILKILTESACYKLLCCKWYTSNVLAKDISRTEWTSYLLHR
jgi:hypothetical protein